MNEYNGEYRVRIRRSVNGNWTETVSGRDHREDDLCCLAACRTTEGHDATKRSPRSICNEWSMSLLKEELL